MSEPDLERTWDAPLAPGAGGAGAGRGMSGVAAAVSRPPRPGQLNVGWQTMLAVTWAAAFFAFAGVWKASVEIGIATWWIGPRSADQPIVVQILPFVLCVGVAVLAIYNVPRVALLSCSATVFVAAIAAFDISRSGGLAAIEFAVAALLLLVSIGSLAGTARRASVPDTGTNAGPNTGSNTGTNTGV